MNQALIIFFTSYAQAFIAILIIGVIVILLNRYSK